jgi:hypothetical protein
MQTHSEEAIITFLKEVKKIAQVSNLSHYKNLNEVQQMASVQNQEVFKILVRYNWICTHSQTDLAWLVVKKITKPNTFLVYHYMFKIKRVPKETYPCYHPHKHLTK